MLTILLLAAGTLSLIRPDLTQSISLGLRQLLFFRGQILVEKGQLARLTLRRYSRVLTCGKVNVSGCEDRCALYLLAYSLQRCLQLGGKQNTTEAWSLLRPGSYRVSLNY